MNLKHLTAALAVVLSMTACGVDTQNAADDQSSVGADLLNAPVDSRNTWSVGVCAGPINTDPAAGPVGGCLTPNIRCTGSLIAPNLVLTARHCVHTIDYSAATDFCSGVFTTNPVTTAPLKVTTSPSATVGNPVWYDVDQVLTSPVTDLSCAGDLVILKLHRAVPRSVARPVFVDVRELTTHQPSQVAVVGRGAIDETFNTTDYSVTSVTEGGLKRRILEHIPFVCVSNTPGTCVAPDIGAPFTIDPGYAEIGQSILQGDSGSGIVRQWSINTDIPQIIAVTSAITVDPQTGVPNFGYGTRVDRHASFIKSTLHQCSPETNALVEN